jgi:hypothetical protein
MEMEAGMAKNKIVPIVLLLVGFAFVLGALFSWLDNLTAQEPVGLGKWVFDVLQFLVGAAGTGLGAWLALRKDRPAKLSGDQRIQEAIDSPDSEQIMEGRGGTQKQKSVRSGRSKQTMK